MKFSRIPGKLLALGAMLALSCNLFNPDGSSDPGDSKESLLLEAQNYFRNAEYTKAYELFSKAVAKDSTCSEGYMGMAKAGMRMELNQNGAGVNPMTLLQYVNIDSTEVPFMNLPNTEKNIYYQNMGLVGKVLSELARRDTLTALYEWHQRTLEESGFKASLSTTDQARLSAFESSYGKSNYAGFPLSDRIVTYNKFSVGLTLSKMVSEVLGFLDFNKDGAIDDRDLKITVSKDENGNVTVDVAEIYSQLTNDPVAVSQLNSSLDSLSQGMGSLTDLVDKLGGSFGLGGDSTSNAMTEEVQNATEEQIQSLQGVVQFYKIADTRDNDGDGCVDEEILDSLDNDGDGLKDEDLRLTALEGSLAYMDNLDNDLNGLLDPYDAGENPSFPRDTIAKKHLMGFTASFVANNLGQFNSDSLELKTAVAADTVAGDLKYPLESRKRLIGGCWVNYNESRFSTWLSQH